MTEITRQNFLHKNQESLKPRERLSDEQMGNILSAVGNHEAKAITLVLMRNETVYDRGNLYREVLNAQGENKGWRMNKTVPFGYCLQSLAPIGLVANEIINPDLSTYGYAITRYGKELGIPLAGLLLDFSERHNIPLSLLFGHTTSKSKSTTIQTKEGEDIEFKKRAPSTTLKILYELLTSPTLPIRDADFEEVVGRDRLSNVPTHVTRLSKLGLIEYHAIEVNKPSSLYRLTTAVLQGELPIYKGLVKLTKSVFDVLNNYSEKYLTNEDVYNLLPKEQKERWKNEKGLRSIISSILYFLAKQKYADIERFHLDKRSEINITDEQRIILTELLEIMSRFQDQDKEILEKGRRLAIEIISNPQKVSNLLRRAKEASGNANQSSPEETQKRMLSIILSNPNGITNKEIQKLLEAEYGKRLIVTKIRNLTSSLVKNGSLKAEMEGNKKIYYPSKET